MQLDNTVNTAAVLPPKTALAAKIKAPPIWFLQIVIAVLIILILFVGFAYIQHSSAAYEYYYNQLGPIFYVLVPMIVLFVAALILLFLEPGTYGFCRKTMEFIESFGPVFGLLGTVLSLQTGFGGLDLFGNIQRAITGIVHTIAVSLGTTCVGLVLAVLAGMVLSVLLLGEKQDNGSENC